MDAQLKAKWVEALRSGEYKQGKIDLHNHTTGAYCCLGVLCHVAGFEVHSGSVVDQGIHKDYTPIYEILGGGVAVDDLWAKNDGSKGVRQHSFAEIADYIEANL